MIAEAAAGSMMDEEWRAGAGAGEVHISAACERVIHNSEHPQRMKFHTQPQS